jgi:Coenzyme PQQ synthesis protein D (PqqD)
MMSLAQRFRPHPEVVDTELEEQEVVLLHLESMRYYSLNLTGMRIWQGLKQGLSLQEISRQLQAEFEVEADRAERSVLALIAELCEQQLVQSMA